MCRLRGARSKFLTLRWPQVSDIALAASFWHCRGRKFLIYAECLASVVVMLFDSEAGLLTCWAASLAVAARAEFTCEVQICEHGGCPARHARQAKLPRASAAGVACRTSGGLEVCSAQAKLLRGWAAERLRVALTASYFFGNVALFRQAVHHFSGSKGWRQSTFKFLLMAGEKGGDGDPPPLTGGPDSHGRWRGRI